MIAFDVLVGAHIVTGTTGLIALWGPVITRNGSALHKIWGRVFVVSMVLTGSIAVGIALCSLIAPLETHTFTTDAVMVRGMFGWMMMYLGILTVAMAWHCYTTVRARRDAGRYRTRVNISVQAAMGLAAAYCALHGYVIGQPLMIAVAVPGFIAAVLNAHYLVQRTPLADEWLVQHFRTGIGAGISVYTAFLAFGAVNWFPALAFNPVLWAIPTVLGVAYMIAHQWRVFRQRQRRGLSRQMLAGRLLEDWGVVRPVV